MSLLVGLSSGCIRVNVIGMLYASTGFCIIIYSVSLYRVDVMIVRAVIVIFLQLSCK
jgi:hypothetical protein